MEKKDSNEDTKFQLKECQNPNLNPGMEQTKHSFYRKYIIKNKKQSNYWESKTNDFNKGVQNEKIHREK